MSIHIPSGYEVVESVRAITGRTYFAVVYRGRVVIEVATYATAAAYAVYHSCAR